jgi:hypothetical protein
MIVKINVAEPEPQGAAPFGLPQAQAHVFDIHRSKKVLHEIRKYGI